MLVAVRWLVAVAVDGGIVVAVVVVDGDVVDGIDDGIGDNDVVADRMDGLLYWAM